MNASVDAAAQRAGQTSPDRNRSTSDASLPICLHRYLRWLRQLHGTIDAISDDAYTLDRLLCQGVLPLRQRTSVTPTAAEAQLRAAVCKLLIGDIAAQSARPERSIWKTSTNTTRSGYSAATFSSAVFPPLIVHTESPSCPCRAYFEQRQREEESRRLSLSQRSSQDKDSDTESHAGHAATISSSSGNDNENKESAVHFSAAMSNFAAKLKHASCDADNTRISSGLASTLLAHTVTLGCIGSNSSSRGDVTASERKARLVSRQSDAPSQIVPLLPVAVATPSPASSAELGSDAPKANSNGDTQCCQRDGRERNKSSASSICWPLPIPIDTATQAHRTLHPMLAHIKPEDVRRCSLCSAQVLLESVWHTLYQMNLLTLLSAAPSMAAPLPLPPPDILRIRPVEALLLLYQCAQRCFVSGIIMATSVGVPASSMRGGPFSSQGDVSVQPLSALDVLRGGQGGGPAATTGLSEQQQRHATEEGVLAGLAGGLLCVVDSVISTAVPHLWPHATIDAPAKQTVEDIMGDVLRLRFELFHTIFVILTAQKGSHAAPAQLATVCGELLSCVRRLPFWYQKDLVSPESSLRSSLAQRSDGATHFSEGDGQGMISNKESVGEATNAVTAEKVCSSTSVDTNPFGAAHEALIQAFAILDAPHTTASGTGDAIDGKEMAVLKDDMSVLCCVAALLVSFARLVHTCDTLASESDDRLLSASEPALPSLSSRLLSSPLLSLHHHSFLLDCNVYPCLQRLQNSIRGDCSVQARHLIALWWLLRAETVRHWVWMETRGLSHLQGCRTFNKEAELHILGVTITLHEDLESEVHPAQEQPHQHWSRWLQDASRAAVRASDVANEFLGLTLIQTWSSASTLLVKKSLSPVASSASMPPPLRWQLPVPSTSFLSLQTPVAFLPLPWIRLWLLLCPPLFRISPADVVALRQKVQRQPRHDEEGSPTAFAVTGKTEKGAAVATDKRKLSQVQQASSRNTHQVGTCAQSKAIQRTTGTPTVLGVSDPSIGSRNRTESVTGATTAPSDNQDKRAKLERRLQLSKAPVCFWMRWFLLFTPSSPVKPESNDSDASRKSSSTLLLSALEYVATDLHGPMTACIEGSPHRATPPTELICLLQQAFPLYTPANLLTALRAQAQLFLARGADLQQGMATEPQAAAEPLAMHETFEGVTFAPHSFAAALAALQDVVKHSKHSWVEAPACIHSHEHDVSRAEISESPSEADPPSSKSKGLVPSPPSVMNRGRTIDSAVPVDAVTQTAGRSGTRRSPLVATRVLSRRVVGTGTKSSATGTEKGEGNCGKVLKAATSAGVDGTASRETGSVTVESTR